MKTIDDLHNAITTIAPIEGISIGVWNDKTTWRIDFDPSATNDQIIAANIALQAFDPNVYSDSELKTLATEKAAAYIAEFFTQDQINAMIIELIGGNTMAQAIVGWTRKIKGEALANYQNPNFDQFTPPDYTYEQVIGFTSH